MFNEVLRPQPEPVICHLSITMALTWEHKEIKSLVRLNQGFRHSQGARRVHVVIDVTRRQQ